MSEHRTVDPATGRKIKEVLTGRQFIMKLHHLAEDKGQSRGTGGYSMEDTPAKGPTGKSKRLSMQETNELLSAGAVNTLRDASQLRGQRNEDFWLSFMQGYAPQSRRSRTFFANSLRACRHLVSTS